MIKKRTVCYVSVLFLGIIFKFKEPFSGCFNLKLWLFWYTRQDSPQVGHPKVSIFKLQLTMLAIRRIELCFHICSFSPFESCQHIIENKKPSFRWLLIFNGTPGRTRTHANQGPRPCALPLSYGCKALKRKFHIVFCFYIYNLTFVRVRVYTFYIFLIIFF